MKTSGWLMLAAALGLATPLSGKTPESGDFTAWARDHAIALPACSARSDSLALKGIDPIIGDARLVALGEPAHGAHEPLAFRNCLFRYLVEHRGFTAIAIESGLSESRRLQDYVAGEPGDARQLVRESFSWGFWRFEENVALIAWMHGYNADPAHVRKIRFYGIDMSGGERSGEWRNARITLDESLALLTRVAPAQSRRIRAEIVPFRDSFTLPGYIALPAAGKQRLRSAIDRLIGFFDRKRAMLVGLSGQDDFAWAMRNAVLARQLDATFRVSRPADSDDDLVPDDYRAEAVRDAAMADNVRWAIDREGAGGRILLFAHNGHVMSAPGRGGIWSVYRQAPEAMGQHLRAALGNRMRIIATSAAANGPGLPGDQQPPGTIDHALAETGKSDFIIDLRPVEKGRAGKWLKRDQSIRTNFTTTALIVPHTAMDAIAFFPSLSPHSAAGAE